MLTLFRSRRVVLPEGVRAATVVVEDGRIAGIASYGSPPLGAHLVELGEQALLPGMVDSHAHINEPGRTEWEGFQTATRAAARGGITTVVDMPLNSRPATTSVSALHAKRDAAQGRCTVDYGFWGGVVPGNAESLAPMVDAGALGFKAFTIHSGVDDFPACNPQVLEQALPLLAHAQVPLLVHAELTAHETPPVGDTRRYPSYLASRPVAWEVAAVRMLVKLCRRHRAAVHIVHLSAADALEDIARAKEEGLPLTVETCPHYLTFCAEEIADGSTHLKCAPPIREADNRERLWRGLAEGLIDLVVSDHSPCTPELKQLESGDFATAWGGISGLQLSLPAVWTGMRARGMSLQTLVHRMAEQPARLAGLQGRKGAIAVGCDADLVVFDPEPRFTVRAEELEHRHPVTPYLGRALHGRVLQTYLRGRRIFDHVRGFESPAEGEWLRRTLD